MRAFFALTVILAALAACQTTQDPVERIGSTIHGTWHDARPHGVRSLNIVELPQSIRQEHQDRANRLDRLSRQFGAPMPVVTDTFQVDPGAIPGVAHAVPVIQVRYPEKTFFDFDSTKIRPEATPILDVLAEAMVRDLPDTGLMVVGHTDSIGSEAYNTDLSLRRAAAVMVELANRGVRIEQMGTASVGEMQPIATNMTDDGRALNRRVEFTLSRYPRANAMVLASVGTRLDLMPNPRDGVSAAGGGEPASVAQDRRDVSIMRLSSDADLSEGSASVEAIQNRMERLAILEDRHEVVSILPNRTEILEVLPERQEKTGPAS